MSLADWPEKELLAACIWAEARGESYAGQVAVGNVILNRVARKMGKSIAAVILKPAQFSWTSPTDPNYQQVMAQMMRISPTPSWRQARTIASLLLTGEGEDYSKGADHYLNPNATRAMRPNHDLPRWAADPQDRTKVNERLVTTRIGKHVFLRLSDVKV